MAVTPVLFLNTKKCTNVISTVAITVRIERHPVMAKLIPFLQGKGIKSFFVNETVRILTGIMQSKRKLKDACLLYTVNTTENAYRN